MLVSRSRRHFDEDDRTREPLHASYAATHLRRHGECKSIVPACVSSEAIGETVKTGYSPASECE